MINESYVESLNIGRYNDFRKIALPIESAQEVLKAYSGQIGFEKPRIGFGLTTEAIEDIYNQSNFMVFGMPHHTLLSVFKRYIHILALDIVVDGRFDLRSYAQAGGGLVDIMTIVPDDNILAAAKLDLLKESLHTPGTTDDAYVYNFLGRSLGICSVLS